MLILNPQGEHRAFEINHILCGFYFMDYQTQYRKISQIDLDLEANLQKLLMDNKTQNHTVPV